jgi:ElaB/YqjD/DUF883 family membrane-anchored ribosome-binding protein
VDNDVIAARAKIMASALPSAINGQAHNHPIHTLGVAALVGLVLGTFFSRR